MTAKDFCPQITQISVAGSFEKRPVTCLISLIQDNSGEVVVDFRKIKSDILVFQSFYRSVVTNFAKRHITPTDF